MNQKKLPQLKSILISFLFLFSYLNIHAQSVPYLPPLQHFGGSTVNLATFKPVEGDYTLEVAGTVGVEISVAGGFYVYTPTENGNVRFAQRNRRVHVYEGNDYKTTLTPTFTLTYPTITDVDAHNNPANLLQNASFETAGSLVGGTNYRFGTPWVTSVTVPSSGGIRFAQNITTANVNGTWELAWRGTANNNYFAQQLSANIKSNTSYKIIARQIFGNNSSANFNFGIGTTVNGMEYGFNPIRLGVSLNGTYEVTVKTPSNVSDICYFTVRNTATSTAQNPTTQTDALTGLDYLALVQAELTLPSQGITGVSSAYYLDDIAFATMSDWAAYGSTDATLSIPTVYGWAASPTITWTAANTSTVGAVRYIDLTNGTSTPTGGVTYKHLGNNYTGRMMFIRWDGNASRVYSYPVYLEKDKLYSFSGKAAFHSTSTAGTLNVRINQTAINDGTSYGETNIVTGSAGDLKDGSFIFSVPADGTYYLTFTSSTASLKAIADLVISDISNVNMLIENSNFTINTHLSANSITVRPGLNLTVANAAQLNTGTLILESNASGTATFINNGTATITTATVEQHLTAKTDVANAKDNWWYIASPVAGATSASILVDGSANMLGYYSEPSAEYTQIKVATTPLVAGTGYLAQINTTGKYSFTGTLNDGPIGPIALTRSLSAGTFRGFNLIGNPYPSHINWNAITGYGTVNERTDIRPTIWLRTRNVSGAMIFDTFDGAIGTENGIHGIVNQHIAPMQAFWVKVQADGATANITFNNALRSPQTNRLRAPANNLSDSDMTGDENAYQANRTAGSAAKAPQNSELQLVRLVISNGTNSDQTIIANSASAVNGYDFYDSDKMSANAEAIPEIFSLIDNRELVINRMNSLEGNTIILGIRPGSGGEFSITTTEMQNMGDMQVVLHDHQLNTQQILQADESYVFTSEATATNERFSLEFRAPGVYTNLDERKAMNASVFVNADKHICISGAGLNSNDRISIYNLAGQILLSKQATGNTTTTKERFSPGVYIVTINNHSQRVVVY